MDLDFNNYGFSFKETVDKGIEFTYMVCIRMPLPGFKKTGYNSHIDLIFADQTLLFERNYLLEKVNKFKGFYQIPCVSILGLVPEDLYNLLYEWSEKGLDDFFVLLNREGEAWPCLDRGLEVHGIQISDDCPWRSSFLKSLIKQIYPSEQEMDFEARVFPNKRYFSLKRTIEKKIIKE